MTILDCQSYDSALQSLAEIFWMPPETLESRLRACTVEARLASNERFQQFVSDNTVEFREPRCSGSYWFHNARVRTPDVFRQSGIKPLSGVLDDVWAMFFDVIGNRLSQTEKEEFRTAVGLDRIKGRTAVAYAMITDAPYSGPFAKLIREQADYTIAMNHFSYQKRSAIADHILKCLRQKHDIDLTAEFEAVTTPCAVKFFSAKIAPPLQQALVYLWSKAHADEVEFIGGAIDYTPQIQDIFRRFAAKEITSQEHFRGLDEIGKMAGHRRGLSGHDVRTAWNATFNGRGEAIPPEQVVDVLITAAA